MKYLFIHHNYPAQFRSIAAGLARQPDNQVFFLSEFKRDDVTLPGVQLGIVPVPEPPSGTHGVDIPLLKSQRRAETFALSMQELKAKGFYPDVIYYHGGWGSGLFAGNVFPKARRINFCEWFFNSSYPYRLEGDAQHNIQLMAGGYVTNHMHLQALASAHLSICPTEWQKSVQPEAFHPFIKVRHEGLDTDFFKPGKEKRSVLLNELGLKIPLQAEIVSYASRGFEPMRGFPEFMRAAPTILASRPKAHIVLMGDDRVVYDQPRPDRRGWLQVMLEQLDIDFSRLHIMHFRDYIQYRRLLQLSDLHVYLTRPYILSWSMLEAMSCEGLILASDTEPVREVAQNGVNMFTIPGSGGTDIVDPAVLAEKVSGLLGEKAGLDNVRKAARKTIQDKYSLEKNLPKLLELLHG